MAKWKWPAVVNKPIFGKAKQYYIQSDSLTQDRVQLDDDFSPRLQTGFDLVQTALGESNLVGGRHLGSDFFNFRFSLVQKEAAAQLSNRRRQNCVWNWRLLSSLLSAQKLPHCKQHSACPEEKSAKHAGFFWNSFWPFKISKKIFIL